MGVWVLEGLLDGGNVHACLVDSVTMTAFGPLFDDADEANAFLVFCLEDHGDPRSIDVSVLAGIASAWRYDRAVAEHAAAQAEASKVSP